MMNPPDICRNASVDTYRVVCKQLDELGYQHPLHPDSLPLTAELVTDVINYVEQLKHYKNLLLDLEKDNHFLKTGIEPYRLDNARLVTENNRLHVTLTEVQEKYDLELRELQQNNRQLKSELADLEFISSHTLNKVKELEKDSLEKSNRILQLTSNKTIILSADGRKKSLPVNSPILEITEPLLVNNVSQKSKKKKAISEDVNVVNIVEVMEKRTLALLEQLDALRLENQKQCDLITSLKYQVSQKDREIERLHYALEGGRPLNALSRDCCGQCQQKECEIRNLDAQLSEAIEKQHEAMTRAVQLAEKNKHLKRELKDLDHMAMAVEEECHSKVKQNNKNVEILQDKLKTKVKEIEDLEKLVSEMKLKIDTEVKRAENLRMDKILLEKDFECAVSDKKALNDRINHYVVVEKNLRTEVTKLEEINKSLQRQLNEMEMRVRELTLADKFSTDKEINKRLKEKYSKKCVSPRRSPSPIGRPSIYAFQKSPSPPAGRRKDQKLRSKDCLFSGPSLVLLDKLQQERDFYHKECHRLRDEIYKIPRLPDNNSALVRQLEEKEQEVEDLKSRLRQEQSIANFRLESGDHLTCPASESIKLMLDRLERERDVALSDVTRLQEERDALKERIKLNTDLQTGEHSRMERIILENEDRIRRLEAERRDLINGQGAHRTTVAAFEEQCDTYKQQLRNTQDELLQSKTLYTQLKALQEETDRSLSDVQGRLTQTESQLTETLSKVRDLERVRRELEDQISILNKEKATLKSNLTCMEREKDELVISLDEKTEKCAKMEGQMKHLESLIVELNEKISSLQKKYEVTINEKTTRDHVVRSLEHGVEHLKQELDQCERQKENALRENRSLQDDLAAAVKDCHNARLELDNGKQEIENIKRQLQQYVNEVKRAEEILLKKESERNEMLDHFRSLSLEATALESNNHTLESAVENTKTQLVSANNRLVDLEHQVAAKDSLAYSYEQQIAELTTHIAELETKLHQESEQRSRAEEDLATMRDLCSTIDGQKEVLRRQATTIDSEKVHLINEVRRLSDEYEGMSQKLAQERALTESLESSLSNSRQETLEHKITNKDLQTNVQHLRHKVDELTKKLESESKDVRRYQSQCSDLSKQVGELRRDITNARFDKARSQENGRRVLQSGCPCSKKQGSKEIMASGENPCRCSVTLPTSPDSSRTFISSPKGKRSFNFRVNIAKKDPEVTLLDEDENSVQSSYVDKGKAKESQHCLTTKTSFQKSCACPQKYSISAGISKESQCISNYVSASAQVNLTSADSSNNSKSCMTSCALHPEGSLSMPIQAEEEIKEIEFEGDAPTKSSRNIPPLILTEESESIASSDFDDLDQMELIKPPRSPPATSIRKLCSILSPVQERTETVPPVHADTSSELSSLPEDSEPLNRFQRDYPQAVPGIFESPVGASEGEKQSDKFHDDEKLLALVVSPPTGYRTINNNEESKHIPCPDTSFDYDKADYSPENGKFRRKAFQYLFSTGQGTLESSPETETLGISDSPENHNTIREGTYRCGTGGKNDRVPDITHETTYNQNIRTTCESFKAHTELSCNIVIPADYGRDRRCFEHTEKPTREASSFSARMHIPDIDEATFSVDSKMPSLSDDTFSSCFSSC